ncbi:hypothetical protein AB0N65_17620 [Paenarthrobacter sp. NPDC089322]|uniref:hypothetical protein n=1 Tax=Paenarthrobacter sp. NPDC089322 TaxID=3155065 RepID=UPI003438ABF7
MTAFREYAGLRLAALPQHDEWLEVLPAIGLAIMPNAKLKALVVHWASADFTVRAWANAWPRRHIGSSYWLQNARCSQLLSVRSAKKGFPGLDFTFTLFIAISTRAAALKVAQGPESLLNWPEPPASVHLIVMGPAKFCRPNLDRPATRLTLIQSGPDAFFSGGDLITRTGPYTRGAGWLNFGLAGDPNLWGMLARGVVAVHILYDLHRNPVNVSLVEQTRLTLLLDIERCPLDPANRRKRSFFVGSGVGSSSVLGSGNFA